jgi:hypothetical protein
MAEPIETVHEMEPTSQAIAYLVVELREHHAMVSDHRVESPRRDSCGVS